MGAIGAAAAFAVGEPLWSNIGALVFIISMFLDRADGELARLSGKTSAWGHKFDLVSDSAANALAFVGIGIGLRASELGYWALILGFIAGAAVAAVLWFVMRLESEGGDRAGEIGGFAGFDPDDAMLLVPVFVLLGFAQPLLVAAAIGAPAFAVFFYILFRRALAQKKEQSFTDGASATSRGCLAKWVDSARRNAILIVILAVVSAVACGWYTVTRVGINTDTEGMLSSELPFRQNSIRLKQAFPQLQDPLLILIEGRNPERVQFGADQLVAKLRALPDLFSNIFDPAGEPFFRKNGLLYLDEDALYDLGDRLADAQPFLGTLWHNPTLPSLFDLLGLAIEQSGQEGGAPIDTAAALNAIAQVAKAQARDDADTLSWRNLMTGNVATGTPERRFIVVQPVLNFASLAPAAAAMEEVRHLAEELDLVPEKGVSVRLSGSAALNHEELESVQEGLGLAGLLTVVMVIGLLMTGLRSKRLVVSTLVTLFAGLLWTAAFATLAVGRLNLISVAFAILFIGLSVDFGIHFSLRYREELNRHRNHAAALAGAAEGVGGALVLSAVAAAIGFFAFLPTSYVGLAELGLISGFGMFIALFANLTLMPALLTLLPIKPQAFDDVQTGLFKTVGSFLSRRHRLVVIVAVVIGLGAGVIASRARFDFDPLNLKDPNSESMEVLRDISDSPRTGPYAITVLAPDLGKADDIAAQARALSSVEGAATFSDFVPTNQEEKLDIILSTALFLEPAFTGKFSTVAAVRGERRRAAANLGRKLVAFESRKDLSLANRAAAHELRSALEVLTASNERNSETQLTELERRLLWSLTREIALLRTSLTADLVTIDHIPAVVRDRYLTRDGQARVEIYPRGDMSDDAALRNLVADVRGIAPNATGAPVIIVEAGNAVMTAFIQAALVSVTLISILIAALLRRARSVVLVFAPLALAALLTIATSVVLNLPFNFANVIVLPLLFGLGVASGIHLVIREGQTGGGATEVLSTCTPRAVLFSALTTIGSFGSMALSGHPGTASMGILLTIAITLTLGCTLVVLPALMAVLPTSETSVAASVD